MSFLEVAAGGGSQKSWISRYKVPFALITIGLLVGVWVSPPPSFLSYSRLSEYQINSFFSSGEIYQYKANNTSSRISNFNESSAIEQPKEEGGDKEFVQQQPVDQPKEEVGNEGSVQQRPVEQPKQESGDKGSVQQQPESELPASESSLEKAKNDDNSGTEIDEDGNLAVAAQIADQRVELPAADPQQDGELPDPVEEEKYVVPSLSYQVGTGNQLIEYKSAAVIARTLNRTLCLAPFFSGPPRHYAYLGGRSTGLYMEDRYDTDVMSRFVKIASLDDCMQKCEKRLDAHWRLRASRPPKWSQWFNDTPRVSEDFGREVKKWSSTEDVARTLGQRNHGPKCVGLGGLFPGLRWRGVFYAASAYLQHSKAVMKAADLLQKRALGQDSDHYISVHWRFEESNCRGHQKGLCFSRCTDGAVIATARKSFWWDKMTREGPKQGTKNGFNAVFVAMSDVSGAIYDRAVQENTTSVYLSTDGWLPNRGKEAHEVLRWVVEDLRNRGMNVAGLWQVPGLPNFADGTSVQSDTLAQLFGLDNGEVVSNQMIALVEQEMCGRSAVFLGSGQSTWSLAVSDARRGRRCMIELEEKLKDQSNGTLDRTEMDQQVIDTILTIQYTAGPTCRGSHNPVPQTEQDEAPDGWLDYAACEERMDRGVGLCTRITQ